MTVFGELFVVGGKLLHLYILIVLYSIGYLVDIDVLLFSSYMSGMFNRLGVICIHLCEHDGILMGVYGFPLFFRCCLHGFFEGCFFRHLWMGSIYLSAVAY